ncbi:MAG: ATP-dependent sacrificial sulfur transferase LarE [Deltaproteobacteria bacterium]|nr:ATP-dependent sacrificial sulfur transferase LarE [Deltaproteobacteria bacterium]MBW2053301.1 ATP-dependent sacrificial sulfur transferase LarE [Deltaproteobacteria bacterium]MBW2141963.1 ATP-dependent sacrificial sulfur transferase LarE [Deltaproteobacteria bacterium]MBW2323488.1 ATP-dependent sacrificial sulfur transferase LarE [Deltaproteobacteria bacterium]
MTGPLEQKFTDLKKILQGFESALVAFSGGVDSSLLLKAASDALPDRVVAITFRSILSPPGEVQAAQKTARDLGVKHLIIDFEPLDLEEIRSNPRDRCYHCKKNLAVLLKAEAEKRGLAVVLEGGNADDQMDYRPGGRAVIEAGLYSPLKEAGLAKADVRTLARKLGLKNWDRPALPCLATRFPYDTLLTSEALQQVFEAEKLLAEHGLFGGRARHHGDILRLELPQPLMGRVMDEELRRTLVAGCKELGFRFVTLDLTGYLSGVFDGKNDNNNS